MKKTIITLLAALLLPATVSAQRTIIITKSDNTKDTLRVWNIESIDFGEEVEMEAPVKPEAKNLGLSVQWASFNFGATTATEPGLLVGWGDITTRNTSTQLKWYPSDTPSDISNLGNDIIKHFWSKTEEDKWRMPTDEELQELIDNCTWEKKNGPDSIGFLVFNPNVAGTDSIFLPVTGVRDGATIANGNTQMNYWSGTINKVNKEYAKSLFFDFGGTEEKPKMDMLKRYMGASLRAVYGEARFSVGISATPEVDSDGFSTAGINSVVFNLQLTGNYANYSDLVYGVRYSRNNDLEASGYIEHKLSIGANRPASDGTYSTTITGLNTDVTYYYCPFVTVNGNTFFGETTGAFHTTSFPKPDYVDMGLSVKWATWNVGATSPTDKGRYIGWGDPKGTNTSTNSSSYASDCQTMYIGADERYDVATAKWGDKWRMPTLSEFLELFDETKVTHTYNTSTQSYTFTSKITAKSITIPLNGLIIDDGSLFRTDIGWYWTASANELINPYYVQINGGSAYERLTSTRSYRMGVRAVWDENDNEGTGDSGSGTGTADSGTGTGDSGTGTGDSGTGDSGQTNTEVESPKAGQAVDLGLSVLWADCNIGATSQDLCGEYIAWGDTIARDTYTQSGYIHYDSSDPEHQYYKWFGIDVSGTNQDAAHFRWGGDWRMPSEAEVNELISDCTWTLTTKTEIHADQTTESIVGYIVTSKKPGYTNKSIFLPLAGYKSGSGRLNQKNSDGLYWLPLIDQRTAATVGKYGVTMSFSTESASKDYPCDFSWSDRRNGLPIRPVRPK